MYKTLWQLNFKVNLFVILKRVSNLAQLIYKLSMTQKYSIELIEEHDAVNFYSVLLDKEELSELERFFE